MSSLEHQYPTTFPAVPPSLSAGDHEMRDYYAAQDTQRSTPNTIQNITPYLGLRSRLSQVWINRWTVLLFLVLVRTLLAIVGLNHDLGSAKTEAMSACSGVESMGSAMASMPHYLSAGVNEMAADGVEKAIYGLMSMLLLSITGVEELIVFYINMLTSTYLCLITLVISGSLHVALKLIEDVSGFLNTTIKGFTNDIHTSVNTFTDDLNKFTSALSSVPEMFGKTSDKVPTIDINSSLDSLDQIQLPSTLDGDLTKLNASIPTFSQVQNFTDNVIRLPFEEVKKLVNGSLHYTFNRSIFPVPQKEQLTFCSDNNGIANFFDDLAGIANLARRIFIAVLVIIAILICIPMAYQEIRRWRTMQKRAQLVGDKSVDPVDVIYIASRPYTASAGIKAATAFKSSKRQILVRWVIAYATSPPALLVLALGVTGLLACLCQYILLRTIEKEVPALANQVGDFAGKVVDSLNNASTAWANTTNGAILDTNNEINHNLFGWVNTTTGAVNDTLNAFVDQTMTVLNDTFGGTVLYDPVTGVFNCLIGLKIAGIQKGLDWVSSHAHVDFPTFNNNTFSLGAAATLASPSSQAPSSDSFLASPGSAATDKITAAVVKVTAHIAEAIRTEAIISTCILLLWVIILLLGTARALYLALKHDKSRALGGPSYAGDIPLHPQPRPASSFARGPAPAYEPPKADSPLAATAFPSFNEPIGARAARTRGGPAPLASSEGETEWQDRKVGLDHAGWRAPAEEVHAVGDGRRSVYPAVEKS